MQLGATALLRTEPGQDVSFITGFLLFSSCFELGFFGRRMVGKTIHKSSFNELFYYQLSLFLGLLLLFSALISAGFLWERFNIVGGVS